MHYYKGNGKLYTIFSAEFQWSLIAEWFRGCNQRCIMRIECVSKWHKNHCKGSCSFGVQAKTIFLPKWLAIIEGYRKLDFFCINPYHKVICKMCLFIFSPKNNFSTTSTNVPFYSHIWYPPQTLPIQSLKMGGDVATEIDPATSSVAPKRANIAASKLICHVMFFLALHRLNDANYANSVLTFANII